MIWLCAGILFALFNAATMLISQRYKLDGHLLSGLRGVGVAALSLPFAFLVDVPTRPLFWVLAGVEALISSFFNSRLYNSSAKYGAGITSRISILAVGFGVVLWWAIDYERFLELCERPAALAGIAVSLGLVLWGALIMAKQSRADGVADGGSAMKYMFPAVITLALMMIVRKEIMENAEFFSATVYYCIGAIFLSGVINLIYYWKTSAAEERRRAFSIPKRIATVAALITVASFLTIFCGNLSSFEAPNPAFVTAITLLSPLMIMAFNRMSGIPDKFDITAVLLMFAGIGMLVFFSGLPLPPPTSSIFNRL